MKFYIQFFFIFVILFTGTLSQENVNSFYLPAEWEPHSGMLISGPDDSASIEMILHLSKDMSVYCYIEDTSEVTFRSNFTKAGVNLDNIHFILSPKEFTYVVRDGLLFLKNPSGEKKLMNFSWNLYGMYFLPDYKDYCEIDKKDRIIFSDIFQKTFPYPVITSKMVNEGGAIETNGKGTILQVESVNMQRNPTISKEEQEIELKRTLNAKKVIWLKEGAADDPLGYGALITENYFGIGCNGHLDEFCRFVNDSTILLSFPDTDEAEKDPVKKLTLERMKVNYEILKNSTDQDGKPFTIIKFPIPDAENMTFALDSVSVTKDIRWLSQTILYDYKSFSQGDTVHFVPASSYANFLISNGMVFVAKYWKNGDPETSKAKDEKVKEILEKYFPDRKIIQINPISLNFHGGGLHCWSMQIPE